MNYKDTIYAESEDGKIKAYGLSPMFTVREVKDILSSFPEDAELRFLEPPDMSIPLHLLCKGITIEKFSGLTVNDDEKTYVTFHLKDRFAETIARNAGSVKSESKAKASRNNGKKGGRPKNKS